MIDSGSWCHPGTILGAIMKLTIRNNWLARDASLQAYPEQFIVRVMGSHASKAFCSLKPLAVSDQGLGL